MSCLRKILIRAAKPQANQNPEDKFVSSPLDLSPNSVGLQRIFCNSGVPVPLHLLAINEAVDCDVGLCMNNSPDYIGRECRFDHDQFAHLYVGTEIIDAAVKHYIIAFVESAKIGRYNELIDILDRTICWLKINNERPYFYIFYHGKQPAFGDNLNEARINITRELKSRLNNYQKETFCYTSRVRTDVTNFTIYDSNPYRFTVS